MTIKSPTYHDLIDKVTKHYASDRNTYNLNHETQQFYKQRTHQKTLTGLYEMYWHFINTSFAETSKYGSNVPNIAYIDLRRYFEGFAKQMKRRLIWVEKEAYNDVKAFSFTLPRQVRNAPLYANLMLVADSKKAITSIWAVKADELPVVQIEVLSTLYHFRINSEDYYNSWKEQILTNPTCRKLLGLE